MPDNAHGLQHDITLREQAIAIADGGRIAVRVEAIGQTKARHAGLLGALSTVELAVLLTTLTDPADRQRMVYDFDRRFRLHAKPAPRCQRRATI